MTAVYTKDEEALIVSSALEFQVGRQKLLSGINLNIKRGEHWLLYGMNGCGKTTLLSILAGFRQQTHGTLQVFGAPFTGENVLEQRKRIGFISSSFFDAKYGCESVKDIVLSGKFGTYGINWGLTAADHNRAIDLLAALGIGHLQYMSYNRLSKGQRQNVLIARAFMNRPELLLLDEPCSGLDVLAKAKFMELLGSLIEQGQITVVMVSHDINEARQFCPNTVLLRNGRIFNQGKTDELICDDILSKFFRQEVCVNPVQEMNIVPNSTIGKLPMQLFES